MKKYAHTIHKKNAGLKKEYIKIMTICIVLSFIVGGFTSFFVADYNSNKLPSQEELIKDFYYAETATSVSPHHIRKAMTKGDVNDFILVDLRSEEEYLEEHIIGAVNIPAYRSRYKSAYGDVERITNSFKELKVSNPDKEIIVYCYSIPCMTGRKIGKMLADHDIYVKHLGVGWNEWRYFWTLWNHKYEWNITDPKDYVASGPNPGRLDVDLTGTACPIENEFGC